jgi:hypothetical protein
MTSESRAEVGTRIPHYTHERPAPKQAASGDAAAAYVVYPKQLRGTT